MNKHFTVLKNDILNCRDCQEVFGFKPNPIFWGNENAKIVHVSQAPSKNVHNTSKRFNDLSGKKLMSWYQINEETFFNPDLFYITAISHCFPGKAANGGDIRPPRDCAKKWLLNEIAVVNNELYLIVGREATNFLFPHKEFKELVFENQTLNNKPAFILPHPSPLNIKWFKNNPQFLEKRLPEIRKIINNLIINEK